MKPGAKRFYKVRRRHRTTLPLRNPARQQADQNPRRPHTRRAHARPRRRRRRGMARASRAHRARHDAANQGAEHRARPRRRQPRRRHRRSREIRHATICSVIAPHTRKNWCAGSRAAWDPWLDWAAERFGARLTVVVGVDPHRPAGRGARPHACRDRRARRVPPHGAAYRCHDDRVGRAWGWRSPRRRSDGRGDPCRRPDRRGLSSRTLGPRCARPKRSARGRLDELRAGRRFIDLLG